MNQEDSKPRIFIECTHTFFNGGNSGIQRVVRNIANHAIEMDIPGVEVRPIIWTGLGFCQPNAEISVKPYLLVRIKKKILNFLYRRPKNTPGWIKHSLIWVIRLVMSKKKRESIFRFFCELPYLIMSLGAMPARLLLGRFVSFRHGDIVVLVDSTWRSRAMLDNLFKAQFDVEIKIGTMFHDLFPLLLPDTCEEVTALGYVDWFNRIVPRADFFVTNSEATRSSLQQYLDKNPKLRPHQYPSGSFRLGAELDLLNTKEKKSHYSQVLWDTPGKAILCIGTIEPRKNYSYMLDVFDLLRQKVSDVSLIIKG